MILIFTQKGLLPAEIRGAIAGVIEQVNVLQETINKADCDTVVIDTPVDLTRIIQINKPSVRVRYELEQISGPDLKTLLSEKFC